jgi:DNA-nicking Smr family endonuclease
LNSKISDKDKKDWEEFLLNKDSLPDKDLNLVKKKKKKIITFDLHGYSLDDANKKISHLIHDAYNENVNKLVIVTGKGLHSENEKDPYVSKDLGILKHSVPAYIKNNNELMSMINEIKDAEIEDGGSGAFYIFLNKKIIK